MLYCNLSQSVAAVRSPYWQYENNGTLKRCLISLSLFESFQLSLTGRLKMQDWKMSDGSAGLEFDGLAMLVKSPKDTVKLD